jgi:hypothetical protein
LAAIVRSMEDASAKLSIRSGLVWLSMSVLAFREFELCYRSVVEGRKTSLHKVMSSGYTGSVGAILLREVTEGLTRRWNPALRRMTHRHNRSFPSRDRPYVPAVFDDDSLDA